MELIQEMFQTRCVHLFVLRFTKVSDNNDINQIIRTKLETTQV